MPPFSLIAAISHDGALGQQGGLPWPVLEADHFWFRTLTMSRNPEAYARDLIAETHTSLEEAIGVWYYRRRHGETQTNAVIMGRTTYESLPAPLTGRDMYVISRTLPPAEPYWLLETLDQALDLAQENMCPHTFVIGGARVYTEALQHPDCQTLYLTEVDGTYPEADTFWPESRIAWAMGRMQTWGDTRNRARAWYRTHSSAWITEPESPRYRFGIWAPA